MNIIYDKGVHYEDKVPRPVKGRVGAEPEELSDDRRRRGSRPEGFCRNGKNPRAESRGAGGRSEVPRAKAETRAAGRPRDFIP